MTALRAQLVIVPCGKQKIWDKEPARGPVRAADAYASVFFRLNRRYAERFGHRWVILSAKYGIIAPEFEILGPYDVSFLHTASWPVSVEMIRHQLSELALKRDSRVIVLGGKEYRRTISAAFNGCAVSLECPFAGLSVGRSMHAVKAALQER